MFEPNRFRNPGVVLFPRGVTVANDGEGGKRARHAIKPSVELYAALYSYGTAPHRMHWIAI